jgi:heat shock protein HtpX
MPQYTSAYSQQSSNITRTWILIFAFVGIVAALFFGMATIFNRPELAIVGLVVSLGQSFVAYFFGDKIALSTAGGVEVQESEAPQMHEMVGNLARISGIPKPKLYISPDNSANAFACGRDPKHASICVNQGLIKLLSKNELEGVLAHEMAHIKNRDILVMTVTMVLSSIISFIADIGFRMTLYGGGRKKDGDSGGGIAVLVFYIVLMVIAPILSALISMAVSRQREYLADATAVVMTRYPEGLIGALEKLYKSPVPTEHYSTAMNHFYIAPPKKNWGEKIAGLFSTHPSIEDRVTALRKM